MSAVLIAEATAYRKALLRLIDMLAPQKDGILDVMMSDLSLGERMHWPAQQVIDTAIGAAKGALYREEAAHEYARDRATWSLNALDRTIELLRKSAESQAKPMERRPRKESVARCSGTADGVRHAISYFHSFRSELERCMNLGIPQKKKEGEQ